MPVEAGANRGTAVPMGLRRVSSVYFRSPKRLRNEPVFRNGIFFPGHRISAIVGGAMNIPRLILSIVVVTVVIMAFDFLYHGMLLGNSYKETADSWRPEDEMMARMPFQFFSDFLISIGFCTVWAFGFGSKGVKCGAIYGFFLGLLASGVSLVNFVFLPIPDQFKIPWTVGSILSSVIIGMVVALVYKPGMDSASE